MENKLTYENAYQQFKTIFIEDIDFFKRKESETNIDETDGAHIQFGMVVVPYLYHLTNIQDDKKIKKCFNFFDKMSKSGMRTYF